MRIYNNEDNVDDEDISNDEKDDVMINDDDTSNKS